MGDQPQRLQRLSLVLLPGLDGTGLLFKWLIAALPPSVEPIVVPLPAETDSDYRALERSAVASLPRDRPFALLGESFSGPLALRIVAGHPPGLVAVILVASFVVHPLAWAGGVAPYLLRLLVFSSSIRRFVLRWFAFGWHVPSELIEQISETVGSVDPSILASRAKAAFGVNVTEEFTRCHVPLLYLGGVRDRLMQRHAKRLQALRPDLEYHTLDASHFVLQGAPVAAAQAITKFLSRHHQSDKAPFDTDGICV